MKNKEKYAEQIVEIACKEGSFGIEKSTGLPVACTELICGECLLGRGLSSCRVSREKWAESEYVEPLVISKRDRAFLDYIGNTYKYVLRDKDNKLFVCKNAYAVNDEWFTRGCILGSDYTYISGFNVQLPMVKHVSRTVWSIEILKKLEVVEEYKET